jgi:hypothetical protein
VVLAAGLLTLAVALVGGYVVTTGGDGDNPASPPASSPAPTTPAPPTTHPSPGHASTLDFTLGSFNVLGGSHTSAGGNQPERPSGRVRAVGAATLLARHGVDVVGFQELQTGQLAVLQRRTGMAFHPGASMGVLDSENSIGWRRDRWVAVERHTVDIPYFAGGRRAMPYVRLRSRSTGLSAWFANFHNPAETADYHQQGRFREAATRIEITLARRLVAGGLPVFVTGDMNERGTYFCRFTAGAPMVAARGGSTHGGCRPGHPRAVDWIFGSRGVRFDGYSEDRSRLDRATTDHPLLTTRVRIRARR